MKAKLYRKYFSIDLDRRGDVVIEATSDDANLTA
jgi:hypothetical protein